MDSVEKEKWLLAGKIGKLAREHGKELSKPGKSLLDVAKEIEKVIADNKAKAAFPPNLSINQIAAHYTPKAGDTLTLKEGDILKIDVGVSVDGFLSDTAETIVVGGSENKLVVSAREALESALKAIKPNGDVDAVSSEIENKIRSYGFSPITNLGGHGIERYGLHEAPFIPNVMMRTGKKFGDKCVVAIEPFATDGGGYVIDSAEVQILMFESKRPVRSSLGRKILDFVASEYNTLPFAKRWIIEKFGGVSELELRSLVSAGALHEFNVLKEQSNGMVAQFEHTVLLDGKDTIVTTI